MPHNSADSPADILIVGGGLMGAAMARLLRESDPNVEILMIDAGAPIGSVTGAHLHDVEDPALWTKYNERVAVGIQGMYTGAEVATRIGSTLDDLDAGMIHCSAFGEEADAMPAAAIAWNAGGMGVHWTAATPWPDGSERFEFGDAVTWDQDVKSAQRVFTVVASPIGPTAPGKAVLEVLRRRYPATPIRESQAMPMAVQLTAGGQTRRTSPATIFPPIATGDDPRFRIETSTLATRILIEDGRAIGVRVRDVVHGTEHDLLAANVVVCADAIRTPQLLFASGIRPVALGRYLNEHAFITARVLMDLDRFGIDRATLPLPAEGEFATDSLWMPHTGPTQPFHGQIMNTTYVDADGHPLAHSVGFSFYSPVESRAENRLVFSEHETDFAGMPRVRFEFEYSDQDLALIDRGLAEVEALAREFGDFDPETERAVLAPGSSLHITGTVRSGMVNDDTSVCDVDGRVWGFDNLFLAGTGVVPTALAANATLTGVVTAVRAARALTRDRANHRQHAPTPPASEAS